MYVKLKHHIHRVRIGPGSAIQSGVVSLVVALKCVHPDDIIICGVYTTSNWIDRDIFLAFIHSERSVMGEVCREVVDSGGSVRVSVVGFCVVVRRFGRNSVSGLKIGNDD